MGSAPLGYLMGQPHRLKHLARAVQHIRQTGGARVWWTTVGRINDRFRSLEASPPIHPRGARREPVKWLRRGSPETCNHDYVISAGL